MSKMNKGYIKIWVSLLTVFIYMSRKTLAAELSLEKVTLGKFV